jgi:FlaA1/EpsC-like NDP-sugar epimerase
VFEQYRPDIVFHAAAYKHVPMLEEHCDEAVFVNVQGTLNVCQRAVEFGCERVVFISTDKAVHPVNTLGYSKRIGEMLVRAHQQQSPTVFCSVRFGNVMGSRGSAIPEFIRQIQSGGPVKVTHPDVQRFFMTIPEAVSLVIQASSLAGGGEIFMLDMGSPIKVGDLVKRLIRLHGLRIGKDVEITYTGLRPGEKLTEELVFETEEARETDVPGIRLVLDDAVPSLPELQASVRTLVQLATQSEAALPELLSSIARGNDTESSLMPATG